MNFPKTRLGITAGVVAGSAGIALLAGLGPAQNLLPIASARGTDDGRAPTAKVDDRGGHGADDDAATPTTTPGQPATQVVDAAGAGTVTVAVGADTLHVVTATPAAGFTARVEVASGREVEVEFRRGTQRVQVNLEIEDGMVRQRLRIRDTADGTDVRVENGQIVEAGGDANDDQGVDKPDNDANDDAVDNSGPGNANDDPQVDNNSGPGAANDDPQVDDRGDDGAAHDRADDHGGHGADDPAGDDHGAGG